MTLLAPEQSDFASEPEQFPQSFTADRRGSPRLCESVGKALILGVDLLQLFRQRGFILLERLDLVAQAPGLLGFIETGARNSSDGGIAR